MVKKVFILLFIAGYTINVQCQRYNFENFSVEQGLAQSEIYAICEDNRGYLWIGTYGGGIVKFDGFTFTTYREEDGLSDNYVLSIYQDYLGILWIGTQKGVCTYDGRKFKPFKFRSKIFQYSTTSIIQDRDRNYWIATTDNGLFKYNQDTLIHFTALNGLPDNSIHCLFGDDENKLWIGTDRGVCFIQNDSVEAPKLLVDLPKTPVRGICRDKSETLWIASYNSEIHGISSDSITNYSSAAGIGNTKVYSMSCDHMGNIWVGTSRGVVKYDGTAFSHFNETNGLANNIILCITEDSSHNLWFGTSGGGVSRFDSERFIHYPENEYMGRMVYTLIEALNGNLIFGTSKGGLTVFDGKQYSLLKEDGWFTSSMVKALYYSKDSTLWIGTLDDGCFRFDKKGFKKYTTLQGLKSNNVTSLASDKFGNIWISSIDSGISILQTNQDTFTYVGKKEGLVSNSVLSLVADNLGNIWAGTDDGGVYKLFTCPGKGFMKFCFDKYDLEKGLTNNAIRSVIADSSGAVFVGTAGGGINVLTKGRVIKLSENEGLGSNNIYSLVFDKDNNLWIGTEQGIDRISFGREYKIMQLQHFGRDEGFRGIELNRNSSCIDKKGNIWFGTVNGATSYNPHADEPVMVKPTIHITGIKLFFNKIENTPFADSIRPWFPLPRELNLPFRENTLTFEFIGIYLRNPKAVRYRWKLEGFDKEWSPALDQREVTYTHLPPGNYTFKVISYNENNAWNETPATYTFEILSPVWQKWWFKISILTLLATLILFVIYFRFRQLKVKNKAEQERLKMERNIIELEQEAARLQMNPHFIFNSLNSIQGFIATEDTFQAKKYLAKFARLMRLILENAREEFIPLSNEVDILENYLELERLSSNNKFEFTIRLDESIDADSIEIPPMMLQPFVENAIVHGIKKKEGKGKISITFVISGQILRCEITDDGIGRQKSAENKAKTISKHKSTGITVTKKRLEQLSIQSGAKAGFEIIDLVENNIPAGTKVIISIPFETY